MANRLARIEQARSALSGALYQLSACPTDGEAIGAMGLALVGVVHLSHVADMGRVFEMVSRFKERGAA